MQHRDWCDRRFHRDPEETSNIRTGCTGPIRAKAGSTAAWLSEGGAGTVVELDHMPGVSLTVQEFADFCAQGLMMAAEGGAVIPGPRPGV